MALPYRPYPIGLRNINNWETVAWACTRVRVCEQERKRETVFKIIMFFFRAKLARPIWRRRRKWKVVDFMCLFLEIKFFLIFPGSVFLLSAVAALSYPSWLSKDRQYVYPFGNFDYFRSVRFCFRLCRPDELSVRPFKCVLSVIVVQCGLSISSCISSCNGQAVTI